MIKTFSQKYLALIKELKQQQWNNYFEKGNHDLGLIDGKIYKLALEYADLIEGDDRESKQAKKIIVRELADKNKAVSDLRNYIDNLDNYATYVPKDINAGSYEYKLALAKLMKADVLELMRLRNEQAQKLGFSSYPELVLSVSGTSLDKIKAILKDFLDKNLSEALSIINKYDLTHETWFSDLAKIGTTDTQYDPGVLTEAFFEMLGFAAIPDNLTIKYVSDGFSGFATEISPNDIRIALAPIESLNDIRTLFHELGHVINYITNKEGGLFRVLSSDLDEPVAVYYEYKASETLLSLEDKSKVKELLTVEYVRCAISALFEFDLWEKPKRAEELYVRHYSELGLKISDPKFWAYDSFRSIDLVYIHNYVIGASSASQSHPVQLGGVKLRTIIVEAYDENWPKEFEKIKNELLLQIGDDVMAIEHVGSTSVTDMWAKPIIDIDVVIDDDVFLKIVEKLAEIGYFHRGDLGVTGREAFGYDEAQKAHLMTHHLYVCHKNSAELKQHLALRNFLRNNEEYRKKYSEIKVEMAQKFPHDIDSYLEGKESVIMEIYELCGIEPWQKNKKAASK